MAKKVVKKEKKIIIPNKPTINLYSPVRLVDPKKLALISAIVLVVGLLFAKFGILDFIDKKNAAESTLYTKQQQLQVINLKMAEFSDLDARYGKYSYGWLSDSESSLIKREDVLEIVETIIAPNCTIDSMSVSQNTLSLSIHGVTLDEGREIVKNLNENGHVSSATLYSAVSTDETLAAKISISVIFSKEAVEK